ncbi:MAG: hypothetical protein IKT82_06610 [Bacteroidaceae bacterium]|nr:hypothetical protein [Bacteroidaceae bacterium]
MNQSNQRRLVVWTGLLMLVWSLVQTSAFSALRVVENPVKPNKDRVNIEHADNMEFNDYLFPGAHRLSGNVRFSHGSFQMFCDSAVYYTNTNSFRAIGKVRIQQGDTLTLVGDSLYYDGQSLMAYMRYNVELRHYNRKLYTDSLDYDRILNRGYFFEGGTLVDETNTLTSDFGEYFTDSKDANFFDGVTLRGPNYTIYSDTLKYNTDSKWAYVQGPSNIHNGPNHIYTELGYYNTKLELAKLYQNTKLTGNNREMTGDSIIYNKLTGDMYAYSNINYHDKFNKNILQGNYVWYNEQTGSALCYDNAKVMDYSSGPDTLYMHADTIKLTTYNLNTDSVSRLVEGFYHVRAYRTDVQAVCDSLSFNSKMRRLSLFQDPIVWSENRQILGEQIDIDFNTQTIDSVYINRQALIAEQVDSVHFNQVSGHQMRAYFKDGEMHETFVEGNVRVIQFPMEKDSLVLYQLYMETAKLKMSLEQRKLQRIWTPAASGQFYGIGMAPREHSVLESFTWFDYVRPLNKDDIFIWRPKRKGTELKTTVRRQAPLQHL